MIRSSSVSAPVRGGDADIPDLARGLHGEQRAQMHQGLTEFSAEMIRTCDRLGLVCDVAYATEDPCTGPWPWVGAPHDRFVVDPALEETRFELVVPARRERLWGATPGKQCRLGPDPVSGSALCARRLR